MSERPDSDSQVSAFVHDLAVIMSLDSCTLARIYTSHSDRGFEAVLPGREIPFTVHISQTANGFWGNSIAQFEEMASTGRGHIVLLRTATSGFFLSNARLKYLPSKFSRSKEYFKINEASIRCERRFVTLDELWTLLLGAGSGAAVA